MNNDPMNKTPDNEATFPPKTSSGSWPNTGSNPDAAGQAKQVALEVVNQTKQVASSAVEQVTETVSETYGEAKRQVASVLEEQKSQVAGRFSGVADALRKTGEHLEAQHETTFAQYAQAAANQIDVWSNFLQTKNLNELVQETTGFARSQPELFIAGSLAAGLVLGRFFKSSEGKRSNPNKSREWAGHQQRTAAQFESPGNMQQGTPPMRYTSPATLKTNSVMEG